MAFLTVRWCSIGLIFFLVEYILRGFLWGYGYVNDEIAEHWVICSITLLVMVVSSVLDLRNEPKEEKQPN